MKKKLLCAVLCCVATLLPAKAIEIRPVVGGTGTLNYMNTEGHDIAALPAAFGGNNFDKTINYDNTAFHAGTVLGVAILFEKFFLELDHQYNFGSINSRIFQDNRIDGGIVIGELVLNFREKNAQALSFKAGYALTDSVDVFAKLDLLLSSFKLSYQNIETGLSNSVTRKRYGIAPGFGIQKSFFDGWLTLRGEYGYHMFKMIKTGNISKEVGAAAPSLNLTARPRFHKFTLGVLCRFNLGGKK